MADAEFRRQFPCARYTTVACSGCMAKSNTARQSVSCLSGWAGRLAAPSLGWSLILSLAPATGWRRSPNKYPQMLSLAGLALILDPCRLRQVSGEEGTKAGRILGKCSCEKGGRGCGALPCVAVPSCSVCLSVCYGERTLQPHFDRPVAVRPIICRLRRGSMIGDVRRRMMDDASPLTA